MIIFLNVLNPVWLHVIEGKQILLLMLGEIKKNSN